jgi:hypothetical protein
MAAIIELKYFNSFWLKKLDTIVEVENTTANLVSAVVASPNLQITAANENIGVGQLVTWTSQPPNDGPYFVYKITSPTNIVLNAAVSIPVTDLITFGPIEDFTYIPAAYEGQDPDWFVEEARIRGGYNNTNVDLGVKAYLVEDNINQQHRISSLIYSGVFNSRTGVNDTNQFSVGEDITRSLDPSVGSIQKLYSEDTNLIIFQESKVSRALIDKDAIYSAEGQPMTTSGAQVIGQVQQYAGNYGISTNPESFAVYGYRKYFTDKNQNAVLRLSQDGITEISAYGMLDFFRDNLSLIGNSGRIIGGWDIYNKQYVLSLQPFGAEEYQTLAFDEDSNGWTSRFSFKPDLSESLRNNFYTFKAGNIWQHYADPSTSGVNYCNFYNTQYDSEVTLIFNPNVSMSKNFNTINYEGSSGWELSELYSNSDVAIPILKASNALTLTEIESQLFQNNFKRKENKYFATIINNTPPTQGEIIYGSSVNGIKGFYSTLTMVFENPSTPTRAELYAVSAEYVESSY